MRLPSTPRKPSCTSATRAFGKSPSSTGPVKRTLPVAPRRWWTEQVGKWGLVELPLTAEALLRCSELPAHHKDPFDRVMIAQALMHDLAVVSPDGAFPPYGVRVVW